jgi:hypothetical protein
VGIEPTTVGSDVTRACTTPQTFQSLLCFSTSLFPHFFLPNTRVACTRRGRIASPIHFREKFRVELRSRNRDSGPRTAGGPARSSRELHHPGIKVPQWIAMDRNDLGGLDYSRVNKQSTRPWRVSAIPSWLLSSCLISASSRSVRIPARPGFTTEVSQK